MPGVCRLPGGGGEVPHPLVCHICPTPHPWPFNPLRHETQRDPVNNWWQSTANSNDGRAPSSPLSAGSFSPTWCDSPSELPPAWSLCTLLRLNFSITLLMILLLESPFFFLYNREWLQIRFVFKLSLDACGSQWPVLILNFKNSFTIYVLLSRINKFMS